MILFLLRLSFYRYILLKLNNKKKTKKERKKEHENRILCMLYSSIRCICIWRVTTLSRIRRQKFNGFFFAAFHCVLKIFKCLPNCLVNAHSAQTIAALMACSMYYAVCCIYTTWCFCWLHSNRTAYSLYTVIQSSYDFSLWSRGCLLV